MLRWDKKVRLKVESALKKPKKGAVARLRKAYNKRRRNRVPSDELLEALKKKEPTKKDQLKKIAKSDRDVELS